MLPPPGAPGATSLAFENLGEQSSPPQKHNPIRPIPIPCFFCQPAQGNNQSANLCLRDGLLVYEDDATVRPPFLCPGFEQGWDCPPVIGDQGQSLRRRFAQASRVLLTQKVAAFPLVHCAYNQRPDAAPQTCGYAGRNMLIEK